ncbi:hypothetical protein GGC47_005447 [Bosea sp. OAE752]
MRYHLPLDFWLWLAVAFNVALSVAACARAASVG